MTTPTADHTDVRATNLAAVLTYVRANEPCSRAAIASSTGLNKATVTNIVGDLLGKRLLRETTQTQNHVGRPATLLVLEGSAYAAIGLELSVTGLTGIAYDSAGQQLLRWHRSSPSPETGPARAVTALATLARRAVAAVEASGRKVLGLTVGVPGLVDHEGTVALAAGLGWRNVELRQQLIRALNGPDFPVLVDNDANLGALAEYRYGLHAGTVNLIQVSGDTGVGAGVISGGRLLRGNLGYGGEIGHLRLAPDGPLCGCGAYGCLEATAGIPALLRRVGLLGADAGEDLQFGVEQLVRRATDGEALALEALTEAGARLGQAITVLADILDPQVVVLGGHYSTLGQWLLPIVEKEVHGRPLAAPAGRCALVLSSFGQDSTAIGAVARSLDQLDSGRIPG